MINFFKGAFRELMHVVWPTKEETIRFFVNVVLILILFGIYLYTFEIIFQNALFFLDNIL